MTLSYERLQAVITCRICHGIYKDPRSLPCTHTFCLTCISATKFCPNEIVCRICARPFSVPGSGINQLPKNIHVGCLIDSAVTSVREEHQEKVSLFELPIGSLCGAVTRKLRVFSTTTAKTFARKLTSCIIANDLAYAKILMENVQQSDRQAVMRELSDDGCSPLFQAVRLGRTDFAKYFLDECNVDIEQQGAWFYSGSGAVLSVTPLWLAAVENKLDIVKFLLQRGANINAQCQLEPSATVLRAACVVDCKGSHSDVIRYLVENGADVNIQSVDGHTCLQSAVTMSAEICFCLIERGARINDATLSGRTALHSAIDCNRLDAVKLLIRHGADIRSRDDNGDDALQLASRSQRREIIEYLSSHTETDRVRLASAYALMGCQYVYSGECSKALECWRLANLQLARVNDDVATFKSLIYRRTLLHRNWNDIKLPNPQFYLRDFIRMQIQIFDETVGRGHPETINALKFLANFHAFNKALPRAIDVCLNAVCRHRARLFKCRPGVLASSLEHVCETFANCCDNETVVRFSDVCFVYSAIVDEFSDTMKLTYARVDWSDLVTLMQQSNFVLFLMLKVATAPSEKTKLLELARSLVRLQPRAVDGQSLLHAALSPITFPMKTMIRYDLSDMSVIETLLEAGIAVHLTDRNGKTALDYGLESSSLPPHLTGYLVDLLLRYGATGDVKSPFKAKSQ